MKQNNSFFVVIFICSYGKPWRKKKIEIFIFDQNFGKKSQKIPKNSQKTKILNKKSKPLLELKNGRKIIFFVSKCDKCIL